MGNKFAKSVAYAAVLGVVLLFFTAPAVIEAANPLKTMVRQQGENPAGNGTTRSIKDEIDTLAQEISEVRRAGLQKGAESGETTTRYTETQLRKLNALRSKLEQLESETKKKEGYLKEAIVLREKSEIPTQKLLTAPPPYPIDDYDRLLDELSQLKQQIEALANAINISKRTIDAAVSTLEKTEKAWRIAKEEANRAAGGSDGLVLAAEAKSLEIDMRLAKASLDFEKIRLETLSAEKQLGEVRQQLLFRQIEWVRKNLKFEEEDLNRQIEKLNERRDQFEEIRKQTLPKHDQVERSWADVQDKQVHTDNASDRQRLETRLKTLDAWRETYQMILEQAENMIRLSDQQESAWRNRYQLLNGQTSPESLKRWTEELSADNKQITGNITFQQNIQRGLLTQISSIEGQLTGAVVDAADKKQLYERLKALQTMLEKLSEYLAYLLETLVLNQQLLEEINENIDALPLTTQVYELLGQAGDLWDFELWVIDDRPVTVKKIAIAFIILILGLLAVKYLLNLLKNRLQQVPHLQATSASTIQKVFSYLAYLLVVLFALRMVNIPLAAFAFLGGAIAIGFGFGAQNLINNFISGFIIMGERPINIGDLIEVDGVLGMVEEIGTRCTRIRTGENIDILVPNSSFLEKNITNWTLKDRRIRAQITVGVAYGSPVETVEELLLESVAEQEKVLKTPKPFVLFTDFGDNALVFDVHFWISIRRVVERRMIESGVRFSVDKKFRAAGITIAFPQRDVHLDTQTPLELRILRENKGVTEPPS